MGLKDAMPDEAKKRVERRKQIETQAALIESIIDDIREVRLDGYTWSDVAAAIEADHGVSIDHKYLSDAARRLDRSMP